MALKAFAGPSQLAVTSSAGEPIFERSDMLEQLGLYTAVVSEIALCCSCDNAAFVTVDELLFEVSFQSKARCANLLPFCILAQKADYPAVGVLTRCLVILCSSGHAAV